MAWKRFWAWPWELKQAGILGINARNLFIAKENRRSFYPRVDDKIVTKEICKQHGIPVPETYGIIASLGDIANFQMMVAGKSDFVVKPARGSGGRGIMVIARQNQTGFITTEGNVLGIADIRYRIATILAGLYSLGGRPDRAIVEQRIKPHRIFDKLAVGGTPDVRIILHDGQAIIAMIRLPTHASGGRANLHQGAVGAGIDLRSGCTHEGVYQGRVIAIHPDTGVALAGAQIPQWQDMLAIAARLSQAIGLGYLGVDIVVDVEHGPFLLEANARPGLAIQIANSIGLLKLLSAKPNR